jgi:hypothetical protein
VKVDALLLFDGQVSCVLIPSSTLSEADAEFLVVADTGGKAKGMV